MGLRRTAAAALGVLVFCAIAGGTFAGASSTSTTLAGQGGIRILDGGAVTVAVSSLPTEYNPLTPAGSNAVTQMVMEQVLPQVFVTGPDMAVHASLGLAVSAEVTGLKPQTVVYTLAKGARWSDGVPITATDFAYDWHHLLSVGPSLPATFPLAGYQDISSVTGSTTAKHSRTVTVVFSKPYADWMALFANLVPAHVARRYGWGKAFAGPKPAHLVSGGPFVVTRIVPGKELVLSRNPSYWGKPAHLAHIVFKVMATEGATLRGLRDGSVDLAELAPGANVDSVVARSTNLVQTVSDSSTLWQLAFNLADPIVGRLAVRQAIAAAINRPEVVADSIGLLAADAAASGNRIYAAHQPGVQRNDSAYVAPDDSEADQLLASVGYSVDANGVVVSASGAPLVLVLTGPRGIPTIATAEREIQAELLQAGIELRISNVARAELLSSTLPRGRYQLAIAPYLESPFPSTAAELYTDPVGPTPSPIGGTSPSLPSAVNRNRSYLARTETEPSAANASVVTRDVLGYADPVVVGIFAAAQSQLNAAADAGLYNQIDTLLWQDLPTLPLFQMPTALVRQVEIVNVSDTATPAGPMWNAQDWAIQVSPPPTTSTTIPGS
ncbi:MAG: ABC transporter family substrate-binding protein [Acidimicrobiales bacterium]